MLKVNETNVKKAKSKRSSLDFNISWIQAKIEEFQGICEYVTTDELFCMV